MTTTPLLRSVGLGLMTSVLVLGCRHAHDDCCDCIPVTTTVVMPAPAALPPVAVTTPEPPPEPPRVEPSKPVVVRDEHEGEEVLIEDTASPNHGSIGSAVGTRSLTLEQAKTLGIRPGYTPGAIYVPAQTTDLATKPPAETDKRPTE